MEIRGPLGDVVLFEHVDELGEGGGHPDAGLVLHALIALAQGLLDDHRQIALLGLATGLVEVHEDRDEGRLAVGGHQGDHLVLDGLDAAADLIAEALLHHGGDLLGVGADPELLELGEDLAADLLTAHVDKGREVREGDGLAPVLAGGHLGDDLRGDVAGG